MTPNDYKNDLLKRIRAAIRGHHDINKDMDDEGSDEEMVPAVYWPSRWLTEAIRKVQTEQRTKDAEFVKKNYVGGSEIADALEAQKDEPGDLGALG